MKELHSVESSVLTGIRLEEGIYRISFEYASTDNHFISSIIIKFVDRIESLKLIYLGPLLNYLKFNQQGQVLRDVTSFSFTLFNTGIAENIPVNSGGRKIATLKIPTGNNRVRFLVNEISRENETKFQTFTWEEMESASIFFSFYNLLMEKLYSNKVILMRNGQIIEPAMTTFYFAFSSRQSKDFIKFLSDATGASGIKKYRINYFVSE